MNVKIVTFCRTIILQAIFLIVFNPVMLINLFTINQFMILILIDIIKKLNAQIHAIQVIYYF